MVQKKVILCLLILLLHQFSIAQESIIATKINALALSFDTFLGYDNQENLYTIQNNVLSKKSKALNYEYKNVSLGKITRVDFQNPLELLIFYKNFNTVVMLDNQLNEIRRIDFNLFKEGVTIDAVALSSQNRIWIYDSISSKIGLYNVNTDSFKWISTMLEHPITYYKSDYTHFYWTDDRLNLYRISIYGTIENLGILPQHDGLQFSENGNYLYQTAQGLFYFDLKLQRNSRITINEKIISKFFFSHGILSIFTPNEITNYKLILP